VTAYVTMCALTMSFHASFADADHWECDVHEGRARHLVVDRAVVSADRYQFAPVWRLVVVFGRRSRRVPIPQPHLKSCSHVTSRTKGANAHDPNQVALRMGVALESHIATLIVWCNCTCRCSIMLPIASSMSTSMHVCCSCTHPAPRNDVTLYRGATETFHRTWESSAQQSGQGQHRCR
jgi:hypothetical protein